MKIIWCLLLVNCCRVVFIVLFRLFLLVCLKRKLLLKDIMIFVGLVVIGLELLINEFWVLFNKESMFFYRFFKFFNLGWVVLVKIKLIWVKLICNVCLLLVDWFGFGVGVFIFVGGVWCSWLIFCCKVVIVWWSCVSFVWLVFGWVFLFFLIWYNWMVNIFR